ncbi:MAG: carbon-nitrogen family hydrolase [Candidatus Hydrothermarchaeales archaeon]
MKVLLAQMDIELGDKSHNLSKAVDVINSYPADIYLYPELFTTGFDYKGLNELSESLQGETIKRLAEACHGSLIGGTILEKGEKNIYNTFVLVSDEGLIGSYRKIHPFGEEKKHFGSGSEAVAVGTDIGKLGLSICYDVRFPEVYRSLMENGTQAALISAEFPVPRQAHWDTLVKARAIENQFFVIAVNRVGKDMRNEYFGSSQVIDPRGNILAKAGSREEFLTVDIDLAMIDKIRSDFPVLKDVKKI